MMFRIRARTVAAAGALTVVGLTTYPALAATTVSQATAQSLNLSIAGTPAVTQIVSATNDGTTQAKSSNNTLPTLAQVLPTNNLLGAGVAPQDAGAKADGTSYACAGIAGTGGGIVHTGDTSCKIDGAPITLGLGSLTLGFTTLDSTSAIGAALNQLGLGPVLNQVVNGAVGNIQQSVTSALAGSPLDLKLGGTLSAIEAVCQATPTAATGATHLVDSQGGSNPTPITLTIPGQPPVVVAQLPANPPVNTHVLVNLNTVTQTVISAVKVELNNAVGGALAPLGLGNLLQQVQDAIVNQLVAQLQPLLQPLQANVLDITLNKQISSDAGKKIDVTALDLQVLPAASQFTGASLISGQLGHVTCGPNQRPASVGTPTVITSPTDGSTVGSTPVITGTAAPGSTVTVTDGNGNTVCQATTNAAGQWQCTPSSPLPVGNNTLTATATGAGASTDPSNIVHITVVAGGDNGGTPGNPAVIPVGVDAGLSGDTHNLALQSALSGSALAAAAGVALLYRRFASR